MVAIFNGYSHTCGPVQQVAISTPACGANSRYDLRRALRREVHFVVMQVYCLSPAIHESMV